MPCMDLTLFLGELIFRNKLLLVPKQWLNLLFLYQNQVSLLTITDPHRETRDEANKNV